MSLQIELNPKDEQAKENLSSQKPPEIEEFSPPVIRREPAPMRGVKIQEPPVLTKSKIFFQRIKFRFVRTSRKLKLDLRPQNIRNYFKKCEYYSLQETKVVA